MPGFDSTGPYGDGPNGRGFGPCRGKQSDFRYGRGSGRRGWFGMGRYVQPYSPQDEIADLEQQKSFLERRLDEIKQMLQKKDE